MHSQIQDGRAAAAIDDDGIHEALIRTPTGHGHRSCAPDREMEVAV